MSDCTRANERRLSRISGLAQNASMESGVVRADDEDAGSVVAQQRYDAMVAEIKQLAAEL